MKVRPCPHNTQTPDYGDRTEEVTAPGPTNDSLDPECPWIPVNYLCNLGAGQ